jgi:hypothetical protein
MGEEDGGHAMGQQLWNVFSCGFRHVIFQADTVFVHLEPVFVKSVEIGVVAGFQNIGIQGAGD